MSFIPGENAVDDISVMEINTTQGRFSQHIIPEQYFVPTYCMQFILKGELRVIVNNQHYTIKANEGYLITPDFLVKKPDDTNPHWQMSARKLQRTMHYLDLLRELIEDKDRTAAVHLVQSLFHYLAGDNLEMWNDKPMSREEEITGRFMHLVDAHCDQHHNLDWYAGQLCLSTRYVANTVKQTLGMTASSCIEFALTQRAKTLLYTTNKSNRHSSECRF